MGPEILPGFSDFILGKHVAGLESKDEAGNVVAKPPWTLILSYEYQARKKACDWVREGKYTLAEAFKMVPESESLLSRYFVTPFTVDSKKRTWTMMDTGGSQDWWSKGKPSRRGKGKGKGKTHKGKGKLPSRTPDGRMICYASNAEAGCPGGCQMVHVCRKCMTKGHGMTSDQCPKKNT